MAENVCAHSIFSNFFYFQCRFWPPCSQNSTILRWPPHLHFFSFLVLHLDFRTILGDFQNYGRFQITAGQSPLPVKNRVNPWPQHCYYLNHGFIQASCSGWYRLGVQQWGIWFFEKWWQHKLNHAFMWHLPVCMGAFVTFLWLNKSIILVYFTWICGVERIVLNSLEHHCYKKFYLDACNNQYSNLWCTLGVSYYLLQHFNSGLRSLIMQTVRVESKHKS